MEPYPNQETQGRALQGSHSPEQGQGCRQAWEMHGTRGSWADTSCPGQALVDRWTQGRGSGGQRRGRMGSGADPGEREPTPSLKEPAAPGAAAAQGAGGTARPLTCPGLDTCPGGLGSPRPTCPAPKPPIRGRRQWWPSLAWPSRQCGARQPWPGRSGQPTWPGRGRQPSPPAAWAPGTSCRF